LQKKFVSLAHSIGIIFLHGTFLLSDPYGHLASTKPTPHLLHVTIASMLAPKKGILGID